MSQRILLLFLASFSLCSAAFAAGQGDGPNGSQDASFARNRALAIYQVQRLLKEGRIDEAVEAMRVIEGKAQDGDSSLEQLATREVRGSVQDLNSNAMTATLARMNNDLRNADRSQAKVAIPSNSGSKVRVLAETLATLLGGKVELLADDGAFFDEGVPEAIFVRKDYSRRVFGPPTGLPEHGSYQSLGGLKYNLSLDVLKKVFQTYGLLKDYGIKNVKVKFETWSPAVSVDCPGRGEDGGSLVIKVPVKRVDVEPGSVFEELKAAPPGYSSKNWWAYREMDNGSAVDMRGDLPKISYSQFVTPARDPSVKNYYLQVASPDPAGLESALMKSCARLRSEYPFSHVVHDAMLFDQMMDQFAAQRKRNERRASEAEKLAQ